MMRVGRHTPTLAVNAASLWVYAESPVTSAKLNLWAGNLEAGFWLLHRAVRLLADPEGSPRLLSEPGGTPLKVHQRAAPDLTVRVDPGFALGPEFLVGLSGEAALPETGEFAPPTSHPRIDAIGIDEEGDWVIETGAEAETPIAPELPEGVIPLCEIHWRVGSSSILDADDETNAYIVDLRPPVFEGRVHRHSEVEQPPESPDGSRTSFTTSVPYAAGSLRVFVNGLLQIPGLHYTESEEGEGYEFVSPPPAGYLIAHTHQPR